MPDYTDIAEKVLAGIQKAGVAMTLSRPASDGVYDPALGEYVYGGEAVEYPAVGLILSQTITQTGSVGQRFFNEVLVQTDDQFVLLAASGLAVDPAPGDLLIITGVTYSIVTMIPIRPGGVDLMFRVLARK